jgi:hypothetical protein
MDGVDAAARQAMSEAAIADMRSRQLQALKDAVQREREENARLSDTQQRLIVVYGQVVQLQHVRSGGFMSVANSMLSESERSASAVHIVTEGRCVAALIISIVVVGC